MVEAKEKKQKIILVTLVTLFVFLIGLITNKYLYSTRYNSNVKISNIEIENLNSENMQIKENDSSLSGYDTLFYDIKYKLETTDNKYIEGRTVIVDVQLSSNDMKYVSWNNIIEDNVKSEIVENGTTLRLTISNVTTNKEYSIKAKLSVVGAPSDYKISPKITVKEQTSEELKMVKYATSEKVITRSISGKVINKEENKFESDVELEICKVDNGVCEDKKTIYTKEDGSFVFTDLKDGRYQIKLANETVYALLSEINEITTIDGNIEQNIEVVNQGEFRASIKKYVKQVVVSENGNNKVYDYNKIDKALVAVKNIKNAELKIIYEFEIKNETDREGYVKVIKENIPNGLEFDSNYNENDGWENIDGVLYNKTLSSNPIKKGETKKVTVTLKTKNTETVRNYLNKVSITGEHYYEVKYVINDKIIKEISVIDSDKVDDFDYSKDGYEFEGWYTDKEFKNKYDFNLPVENDLVLYGKLKSNKKMCDVTYLRSNGDEYKKDTIECGTNAKDIDGPTDEEGKEFNCWELKDSHECFDFDKPVEDDIELIADMTPIKLNVTFIDQGKSYKNGKYDQKVEYGKLASEPKEKPKMENHSFLGWTLDGKVFDFNTKIKKDITLVSSYDTDMHDVIFIDELKEDDNHIYEMISQVKYGSQITKPIDPTHEGYKFLYWYKEAATEQFNFETETMPNENLILYAKYEKLIFNVEYKYPDDICTDKNNCKVLDVDPNPDPTPYDDPIKKPKDPKLECKKFKYWSLYQTGLNEKGEEARFDFVTERMPAHDITLYAIFEDTDVTVIYVDNGKEIEKKTIACGSKIVPKKPECEGDDCDKCTDPDGCPEFECWRDAEDPSTCIEPKEVKKDLTLVSSYIKLPEPVILHVPTEWTREDVEVSMSFPENVKKKIKRSNVTTNEDGSIVYGVIEEEIEENLVLTKEEYDIKYQVVSEKESNNDSKEFDKYTLSDEWNTYSDSFIQEKNSIVVGKVVTKNPKTNYSSKVLEHEINNIDKKAPTMNNNKVPASTYIKVSGTVNDKQSLPGKVEIYYIEGENIDIVGYLNDETKRDLVTVIPYEFSNNILENKDYTVTITDLTPETTYTVGIIAYDNVLNKTDMDLDNVTTLKDGGKIVAQIIRRNGVLLPEEEWEQFSSLELARQSCGDTVDTCTIQMLDNTTESVEIGSMQNIELDINGYIISGLIGGYTIRNNGTFRIVDDAIERGKIENTNDGGIAIDNLNILILGRDDDEVSQEKPHIIGMQNGIKNTSILDFYDGIVQGNVAIDGSVRNTPEFHIATEINPGQDVQSIVVDIPTDYEAKIGQITYKKLSDAIENAKTGEYIESEPKTGLITSLAVTPGAYGFDYNTEDGSLTNNNQGKVGQEAYSYIKFDLTNYTEDQQLTVNAEINNVATSSSYGYAIISESESKPTYVSASPVKINGITIAKDYTTTLVKGKIYYLHLGYVLVGQEKANPDIFKINNISLAPLKNLENPELVTTGDYGFTYDSETGKIVNDNQEVANSTASAYIKFDLTGALNDRDIIVKLEANSLDNRTLMGGVVVSDSDNAPSSEYYVHSIYSKSYVLSVTLKAGQVNYLHFIANNNDSESATLTASIQMTEEKSSDMTYIETIPVLNNEVDTIQLLKYAYLSDPLKVEKVKDVVLDLNGHTIESQSSMDYMIENYGKLKIIDSKFDENDESGQQGKIISTAGNIILNEWNAKLILEQGIIDSKTSLKNAITNNGELSYSKESKINVDNNSTGILNSQFGLIIDSSGTINVTNGTGISNYSEKQKNFTDLNINANNGIGLEHRVISKISIDGNSKMSGSGRLIINQGSGTIDINIGNSTISATAPTNTTGNVTIDGVNIIYSIGNISILGTINVKSGNIYSYVPKSGSKNYSIFANIPNSTLNIDNGIIHMEREQIYTGANRDSINSVGRNALIANGGVSNINNATLNSDHLGIYNIDGTLNITGNTTISSKQIAIETGIVNISGNASINESNYAVHSSSTLNIDGNVYIKSKNYLSASEINMGQKDGIVNTEYPKIVLTNEYIKGNINYYDGMIISENGEFLYAGYVLDLEDNYDINVERNEKKEIVTLASNPTVKIGEEEFLTIQDAIDSITTDENTTIVLIRDIDTGKKIDNSKNVVLDFNGFNIRSYSTGPYLTNSGGLVLKNSNNQKESSLHSTGNFIINTGVIDIIDLYVSNNNINNDGTMNIYAKEIESAIRNNGELNIFRGIISTNSNASIITNYATGVVNLGKKGDVDEKGNLIVSKLEPYIKNSSPYKSSAAIGNSGIVNFYDGIIEGVKPISGNAINECESGYIVQNEVNGTWTKLYLGKGFVARIKSTGEEYTSVQDAVDAVEKAEETIEIIGDIASSEIEIPESKNIKIDLLGHSIRVQGSLVNNGTLLLSDTSPAKTGRIGPMNSNVIIQNNGNLKITGGIYETTYSNGVIENNGILDISGGEFDNKSYSNYTILNNETGNLNISGGTIKGRGETVAIYVRSIIENKGTLDMSGGTVSAYAVGGSSGKYYLINNYNKLNISSGTLEGALNSAGEAYAILNRGSATIGQVKDISENVQKVNSPEIKSVDTAIYNYNDLTINDVRIGSSSKGVSTGIVNNVASLNMLGGEINASTGIQNVGKGTINIGKKDGAVSQTSPSINGSSIGVYDQDGKGIINFYDGKIKGYGLSAINGYITEIESGYEVVPKFDGNYQIKYLQQITPMVEILDESGIPTTNQCGDEGDLDKACYDLQTAIDKSQNGETIRLYKNVELKSQTNTYSIPEGKHIIFDLYGFFIIKSENNFIENNGTLEITDSFYNKGMIIGKSGNIVKNVGNGLFTLTSGEIKCSVHFESESECIAINNMSTNKTIIDGGIVTSETDNYSLGSYGIYNSGGEIIVNQNSKINSIERIGSTKNSSRGSYGIYMANGKLTFNGGTITATIGTNEYNKSYGIGIAPQATAEILGGTITSDYSAIENRGNLTISGGRIGKNASLYNSNSAIENFTSGQMNIDNGEIYSEQSDSSTLKNSGNLVIDGGNIVSQNGTAIYNNGTMQMSNVSLSGSKVILENIDLGNSTLGDNVTITATDTAIKHSGGGLTIGIDDGVVSTTNPSITGVNYGINSTANINFNDGIITGAQNIFGDTNVPENYQIKTVSKADGTITSTLEREGFVESIISYNGINYADLQSTINLVPEGTTGQIYLFKDIELTSDIVIPEKVTIELYLGEYNIIYNDYTIKGPGTITIIGSESEQGGLTGAIMNMFTKNKSTGKNIIAYEMDDGSKLNVLKSYELQVYKNGKYESLNVKGEINNVGRYYIDDKSANTKMMTINGKLFLNNLSEGEYKLLDNDGKELLFTISDNGSLTGNIKENYTNNLNKIMSTAYAELIVSLQTGQKIIRYGLILFTMSLLTISLLIIKKNMKREA